MTRIGYARIGIRLRESDVRQRKKSDQKDGSRLCSAKRRKKSHKRALDNRMELSLLQGCPAKPQQPNVPRFSDQKNGFRQVLSDPHWLAKVLLGGFLLINPFLVALAPAEMRN